MLVDRQTDITKPIVACSNVWNAPPIRCMKLHCIVSVKGLCSSLLSRNLNYKVYRTIILPVVFVSVKLGR
jgi:hypothetical protein